MSEVQEVTKQQAASALLDRAIKLYLDEHDYIPAIVLAGSAEVLCGDLIKKHRLTRNVPDGHKSPKTALDTLKALAVAHGHWQDGDELHRVERFLFNWTRHANNLNDPMSIEAHWQREAEHRVDAAVTNFYNTTDVETREMQRWRFRETVGDDEMGHGLG